MLLLAQLLFMPESDTPAFYLTQDRYGVFVIPRMNEGLERLFRESYPARDVGIDKVNESR